MNDFVNNEAVFTGPVIFGVYGNQEAGFALEGQGRALMATMMAVNGVNERVAAGEPGGFFTMTDVLADGTRIVVQTNNGIHSINIFAVSVPVEGGKTGREVKIEEELIPCARAGVRYYDVKGVLTEAQPAIGFSYQVPHFNTPDPEYDAYVAYYATAFDPETGYPNPGHFFGLNPGHFPCPPTKANPCLARSGNGSDPSIFSCVYDTFVVDIPATPATIVIPQHLIQLVSAGKIAYWYMDDNGNTKIRVLNNDADFTTSADLSFPAGGIGEIGWPAPWFYADDEFNAPVRVVDGGRNITPALPVYLKLSEIEYVTDDATYLRKKPPTAFRFSNYASNYDEVLDYCQLREIYADDIDGAACVTSTGKWKGSTGVVTRIPFDGTDPDTATFEFPELVGVSYMIAVITHDIALETIVGIALKRIEELDFDQFVFFVLNEEEETLEELASLDIAPADFLPVITGLQVDLVQSMLANEGVAVVSFGSTYQERNTGAARFAVIEYCDPKDEGTTKRQQITTDYKDGALVNRRVLPLE